MMISEYGMHLRSLLSRSGSMIPDYGALDKAAGEILTMAYAYHSDGSGFLSEGDDVNAIASYAYGRGWLDAGVRIGVIAGGEETEAPMERITEPVPEMLSDHLREKSLRYRQMLNDALETLAYAPAEGSLLSDCADAVYSTARSQAEKGSRCLSEMDCVNALVCFSYGHGWLDAGVRVGLFRVTGRRDLFTI